LRPLTMAERWNVWMVIEIVQLGWRSAIKSFAVSMDWTFALSTFSRKPLKLRTPLLFPRTPIGSLSWGVRGTLLEGAS
jgi:hypothetical protein